MSNNSSAAYISSVRENMSQGDQFLGEGAEEQINFSTEGHALS